MDELTPKQRLFVDGYLATFNGTEAARRAGYAGNDVTLAAVAWENLRKPLIVSHLTKRFKQIADKNEKRIINTHEELEKNLDFVSKLRTASEKWLVDPNNPEQFTIDPRANEIDVVWFNGETQQRATLAELLALVSGHAYAATPFVKTVDLREYALKCVDRIETTLDKFAKIYGEYTKERSNPLDIEAELDRTIERHTRDMTPEDKARFIAERRPKLLEEYSTADGVH